MELKMGKEATVSHTHTHIYIYIYIDNQRYIERRQLHIDFDHM